MGTILTVWSRCRSPVWAGLVALVALLGCSSGNGGTTADGVGADTPTAADSATDWSASNDSAADSTADGATASDSVFDSTTDWATDSATDATPDGSEPPLEGEREVIAMAINRACIGCDGVSICQGLPMSDRTAVTFDASPNNDTGVLFAAERFERAGLTLALDSCLVLEGAAREAVIEAPHGVDCMDAGTLSLSADMPLLEAPTTLDYQDVTGNYPSVFLPVATAESYVPGAAMNLEATGGEEVAAFSCAHAAPEPIEILTPHLDEDGQVDNVATDAALDVTWSGGNGLDELTLYLYGYYCQAGPESFAACRVANDGAFTIPADIMQSMTWPTVVELYLSGSHKEPIAAPALLGEPAWSVRAVSYVFAYYDPDVAPPVQTCDSESMAEGSVGAPCETDADCGGGCCLRQVEVYFEGNYCTLLGCESDDDCPADAACVAQNNPFLPVDDYCGKRCTSDDDCRFPEYACLAIDGGATVCRPNFW